MFFVVNTYLKKEIKKQRTLRANIATRPIIKPAQGGLNYWRVATDSLGTLCLRGIRDDLIALAYQIYSLSNQTTSLCDSTNATRPIIKPAQGGLNSWLAFVSYFRTHYDDRLKQMSTEIEKLILNNG